MHYGVQRNLLYYVTEYTRIKSIWSTDRYQTNCLDALSEDVCNSALTNLRSSYFMLDMVIKESESIITPCWNKQIVYDEYLELQKELSE